MKIGLTEARIQVSISQREEFRARSCADLRLIRVAHVQPTMLKFEK